MMRVNNSTALNVPAVSGSRTSAPSSAAPANAGQTEHADLVMLSEAGASALSGRSERIAELKSLVDSSSYAPPSSAIGKKVVSDALSRGAS